MLLGELVLTVGLWAQLMKEWSIQDDLRPVQLDLVSLQWFLASIDTSQPSELQVRNKKLTSSFALIICAHFQNWDLQVVYCFLLLGYAV